jgi:hypothetical protein
VVADRHPAEALVSLSAHAELLVVGSRGHGGFGELLLGSVSHAVVLHAVCPVVVVHPSGTSVGPDSRASSSWDKALRMGRWFGLARLSRTAGARSRALRTAPVRRRRLQVRPVADASGALSSATTYRIGLWDLTVGHPDVQTLWKLLKAKRDRRLG